jgi:predicted metalloprotease with PDZ domain
LDRSLGLWFSADRAFDAQMKIVIAHEFLHRWVGSDLRIRDAGGADATWFSEGFTAHYARRTLFDAGLVDQAAFLDDLRRTTSDGAASDPREYAERRGAIFAAWIDAAVRRRSAGARSLDDVMRGLVAASRSAHGEALPLGVFRDLLVQELGASGGDDLDRFVDPSAGAPIDLPSDAFGPCFEKVAAHESFYELGFDRRSLDGIPAVLRRLVVGSAAEKAGVREGAIVLKAKVPLDVDTKHEVDLTVADHRGTKRIRYRPEGARVVMRWQPRDCR